MTEPTITINGYELTPAQAMAVRVAVTSFHAEMSYILPDAIGQPRADAYAARLTEVLRLMLPS
jgi:hypothetical protein